MHIIYLFDGALQFLPHHPGLGLSARAQRQQHDLDLPGEGVQSQEAREAWLVCLPVVKPRLGLLPVSLPTKPGRNISNMIDIKEIKFRE